MSQIIIANELKSLPESKARMIKDTFDPMVKMLESFEGEFNRVSEMEQTEERSTEAKKLRLAIAKIRIEADKVRKEQKDEYLRAGNAIQGVYNILRFAVEEKENKLKDIETYYERIEAEKIARIQAERESELLKYEADSAGLDLGKMPETVWSTYLSGVKSNYESAMEAERKAEEYRVRAEKQKEKETNRMNKMYSLGLKFNGESFIYHDVNFHWTDLICISDSAFEKATIGAEKRIKEIDLKIAEEQEEIRKENERLKAEADKKEAERKKAEEKAEKERQAREAELQKEREERAKLEKEQREKEERELKEAQSKAEAEKKASQAPDKEKLLNYSTELLSRLNSVQSPEAKQAIQEASYVLSLAAEKM